MDPKHQFAAQYVLSRAAAERRERESLLAAAVAASSAGSFGLGGKPKKFLKLFLKKKFSHRGQLTLPRFVSTF